MWRVVKNSIYVAIVLVLGAVVANTQPAFGATKIQANICGDFLKPSIISPLPDFETSDSSVLVTGSAQPYLAVAIAVNGVVSGITAVAGDGTYAAQIPLNVGDNTLVASDGNGCGLTKDSDSVMVHRSEPRVPVNSEPIGAQPIEASPVQLPANVAAILPHALEQPAVQTPISPGYEAPIIRQPTANETYTSNHVWVVGTAVPGSIVTVYVNDMSAAKVTASAKGSYASLVELKAGNNTLQVKSEKDGLSAFSKKIVVAFNEASPTAPSPSVGTVLAVAAITTTVITVGVGAVVWTLPKIRIRIKW